MSRFWSAVVHGLTPYVPGEQPRLANLVKLNTNENPYGPGPRVLEALRAELGDPLRLYPDPLSARLRQAIATSHGLTPANASVSNASPQVLTPPLLAFPRPDLPLLLPHLTSL